MEIYPFRKVDRKAAESVMNDVRQGNLELMIKSAAEITIATNLNHLWLDPDSTRDMNMFVHGLVSFHRPVSAPTPYSALLLYSELIEHEHEYCGLLRRKLDYRNPVLLETVEKYAKNDAVLVEYGLYRHRMYEISATTLFLEISTGEPAQTKKM